MTDIGFVNGLMEQIDNCRTEESIMPMSCKCILDRMVFKGAMTEKERDKIQRNLHERKTGKWVLMHPLQEDDGGAYVCSCCGTGSWEIDPATWKACPWCTALMEVEE